ncbi:MAG: hypothetical protein ABSC23_02310 [Bryobacteraceae bacterium]
MKRPFAEFRDLAAPISLLATSAVLLRLFFWAYTHRVWEDALITVLHSENFVRGLGLTHYRVGEARVYGFTSALGVLIPLLGDLVHVGFGLSLIKIVSALASAAAVTFAILIGRDLKLPRPLLWMVGGYAAFEHHQILFGMAGMETQLVVAAVLFSIWSLFHPSPIRTGVALGICMLARPDFCLWVSIAGLFLLAKAVRGSGWRDLGVSAAAATVVFAPWLIFTWVYYGSPIPNTILAKAIGYGFWIRDPGSIRDFKAIYHEFGQTFEMLGPGFGGNGSGWHHFPGGFAVKKAMVVLVAAGLVAAIRRRDARAMLVFSFVAVYGVFYAIGVPCLFCWYIVPFAAVSVIGAAYGAAALLQLAPRRMKTTAAAVFAILYVGPFVCVLPVTMRAERNIQAYVEDGVRKPIGQFLGAVSAHDDTIGCEPLGYIAYYSRRTVYDFPGLASRRVVDFLRLNPDKRSLDALLDHFRPTYLVLREEERREFRKIPQDAWIDTDYALVREFQAAPDQVRLLFHPEDNIDLHFCVLRRIRDRHGAGAAGETAR